MKLLRYAIAICIVGSGTSDPGNEVELCEKPDWFKCENDRCLSTWFVCDGEDDCGDNSDEINCSDVQKICTDFRCKNGDCVENHRACDGFDDCPDRSDETDCGNRTLTTEQCSNQVNRFLCDNGRCISLERTCNGIDDCGDRSDENVTECTKAEELCKMKSNCSHYCNETVKGPVCSCPFGHKLTNYTTCTDINECDEIFNVCDQHCVNNAGSYHCECEFGYELQDDGRTCKAGGGEALMLFSTDRGIHGLYLESRIQFPMIVNSERAIAVAKDADYVYWSEMKIDDKKIMRSREDGESEVIAIAGIGVPEHMALDWLTGNLYFTDGYWKHIGVCRTDGSYCTAILCDKIDSPTGLVLHPKIGALFFSECGSSSSISRADMDGEAIEYLVSKDLGCPGDLTIDYPDDRLYFVDARRESVESVRLSDGKDRRVLLRSTGISSIALFESKLYWSDRIRSTIESVDKRDAGKRSILMKSHRVNSLRLYHSALQPEMENPCERRTCSQLCLLGRNGTCTCACKLDESLSDDGRTCISATNATSRISLTSGYSRLSYRHEILGKPVINVTEASTILRNIAYDPINQTLIINDPISSRLLGLDPRNEETRAIGYASGPHINCMDFDPYGNNIYTCNAAHRSIEIQSVSTGERIVRLFEDEPRDILVVPDYGRVYVVFKTRDDEAAHIDILHMSAEESSSMQLALYPGNTRISLAWDAKTKSVFVSDETTGSIDAFSIVDNRRRHVRSGLMGIVNMVLVDRKIFWTTRNSAKLRWIDGRDRYLATKEVVLPIPKNDLAEIIDLTSLDVSYDENWHPCRYNNGGCSHVCLSVYRYDVASGEHVCACPNEMSLDVDASTCRFRNSSAIDASNKCPHCALC